MPNKFSGDEQARTKKLLESALCAQKQKCFYCGARLYVRGDFADSEIELEQPSIWIQVGGHRLLLATADHLIRRRDGGKSVPGNVVAACHHCNHKREANYKHTTRIRKCQQCGQDFKVKLVKQRPKFCPECNRIRHEAWKRAQR